MIGQSSGRGEEQDKSRDASEEKASLKDLLDVGCQALGMMVRW